MSITVTPVLRSSKLRADGRAPVWVRITANRKSRYVSTGIYIQPKYWNENKQTVRSSHELASAYNNKIRRLEIDAQEAALRVSSAQAVKDEVTDGGSSLSQYFERFIAKLKAHDQYWERKKYRTTLNKLHGALGKDLSWDELTPDALSELERYCVEKKGNNPNTTRKELSRVRRVANQAIKDGVLRSGDNPFQRYDMPEGVEPDRRSLNFEHIQALASLNLDEGSDLLRDRDAFVFAFYGGGVRFSDVCQLRPENISDERLRYRMMKTGRVVDLCLPETALQIAERWKGEGGSFFLFPYLEDGDDQDPVHLRKRISVWNQMANRSLKVLAEAAEIPRPDGVTFHVSRHSFADLARRSSGDLYAVSKALGHSNLSITERYLAPFDREAVDTLTTQMWKDDSRD
jgi:integrase